MGEDPKTHRVTFVHSGAQPITVDLDETLKREKFQSWEGLPVTFREIFDQLDQNHDGTLVIGPSLPFRSKFVPPQPDPGEKYVVEVGLANQWRFFRSFAAFLGDHPYAVEPANRATAQRRERLGAALQDIVYRQFLPQVVTNRNNARQWRMAAASLSLLSDFKNLYGMALKLESLFEQTKDRRLLQVAHFCLEEAARFAPMQPSGRQEKIVVRNPQTAERWEGPWYGAIEEVRHRVGDRLDALETADFEVRKKYPYFLKEPARPVELGHLAEEGSPFVFRVSLPPTFKEDPIDYFTQHPIALRPTPRWYQTGLGKSIPLVPVRPLIAADLLSGTYYDQKIVDPILFGQEGRRMILLGFALPEGVDPKGLVRAGGQQSYDLVVSYPTESGLKGPQVVEEVVVVQDLWDQPVNYVVAGDGHMDRRSQKILPLYLEVWRGLKRVMDQGGGLFELSPAVASKLAVANYPFIDSKNHFDARMTYNFYSMNENIEVIGDLLDEEQAGRSHLFPNGQGVSWNFHAGDTDDYNNEDPTHTRPVSFRRTNKAVIEHSLLDKSEIPTHITLGNHGPHLSGPALTYRRQNWHDPALYEFVDLADWRVFGTSNKLSLLGYTLNTLETQASDSPIVGKIGQLKKPDAERYEMRYDALAPYYRYQSTSDLTVTRINRGTATVEVETGIEDFLLEDFVENRARAPKLRSINKGRKTYIDGREANLNGPKPKLFGKLLQVVDAAASEGVVLNLVMHGPLLHGGVGPDGTAHSVDTLRGPPNKAFRLLLASYEWERLRKFGPGTASKRQGPLAQGPVIPLVTAFHLHHFEAYFMKLQFNSPEDEEKVFREVFDVWRQAKVDPYHVVYQGRTMDVYEAAERIWEKHKLSTAEADNQNRMKVRTGKTFEENFALVREFNQAGNCACQQHGVFMVNGPSAGHPPAGFLKVMAFPDGSFKVFPHYVVLLPTGEVIEGQHKTAVEEEQARRARDWMASMDFVQSPEAQEALQKRYPVRGMDVPEMDAPSFEDANGQDREPRWDFPFFSCGKGWICAKFGGEFGARVVYEDGQLRFKEAVNWTPLEFQVPLLRDPSPGEPQSIHLALDYDQDFEWMGRGGLGWNDYRAFFHTNFRDVFGFSLVLKRGIGNVFPPFGSLGFQALYQVVDEQSPVNQTYQFVWRLDFSGPAFRLWGPYSDY